MVLRLEGVRWLGPFEEICLFLRPATEEKAFFRLTNGRSRLRTRQSPGAVRSPRGHYHFLVIAHSLFQLLRGAQRPMISVRR